MPRYQVLEDSYVNDMLYRVEHDKDGKLVPLYVEFAGLPGPHLKPMDKDAEAMFKKVPSIEVQTARFQKAVLGAPLEPLLAA